MVDNRENLLLKLTAKVVIAYLTKNVTAQADLVRLISTTYAAVQFPPGRQDIGCLPQVPAIPIRKSLTVDCIYCLEDGIGFKALKRHLKTRHGLTPDQYRQKWALSADYPMVARGYSARRAKLAQAHGPGRKWKLAQ